MKTIMLCLNKLDIGGIETAVLNQTINLIKRKYRVVIAAADGIYREKFEDEGAIFIEINYSIKDMNICEKVKKIEKVIEKYQVEQVHIHQFECINIAFFACMLKNIPYVAYLHNSIEGTYEWYESVNNSYAEIFKMYFKYAEKIVAIQEKSKIENKKKFCINDDKYLIIRNSIDFDKFKINDNDIPKKIEKFLIISRFSNEKEPSIFNAINLFRDYYKINKNARLTIVGDGELKNKIEDEIKDIKNVAKMLGKRNDIAKIISKNDIVVSLDRCILEAITMKRIAIVSGYKEMKEIVTLENIERASNNNFNGDNLNSKTNNELIEQIDNLDENMIRKIVEQNYQYAYENLNINKNFYIIKKPEELKYSYDNYELIKNIMKIIENQSKNIEYTDKVYKECREAQKWFEGQIKIKDNEVNELKLKNKKIIEELTNIYNSKSYKLFLKINKLIKKIFSKS